MPSGAKHVTASLIRHDSRQSTVDNHCCYASRSNCQHLPNLSPCLRDPLPPPCFAEGVIPRSSTHLHLYTAKIPTPMICSPLYSLHLFSILSSPPLHIYTAKNPQATFYAFSTFYTAKIPAPRSTRSTRLKNSPHSPIYSLHLLSIF